MCEHEMAARDLAGQDLAAKDMERLAREIYGEICRQFDADGPCVPRICDQSGLRSVIVEGQIDLIRLASTLAKRFCVRMPEIETVGDLNAVEAAPQRATGRA
jgi:hypothetical protein